ncbi:simple sugar transport system permease protein [Antricoccus suffuscus]|uniref:Simple sugar transport system permease protein n=1 Tax=Antricoccus suffuscus TaxID=1629062 RepID=A0A2T0ZG11_9ACTN|nr:ABC transporter permease [Antricoccus suffuscus]PRZ35241.1 simple sugar transport system permease protein [Antricoccus suffuscus]
MTEPTNRGESNDDGDRTPDQIDGVTATDLEPERESVSGPSLRQARIRKLGLTMSAPVAAFIFALVVVAIVIIASGFNIGAVLDSVNQTMSRGRNIVELINRTGMYYISALAVAVGFRMNLFNIGVEGQYRLAALVAAYVGASVNNLPAVLHILVMIVTASITGAIWAGIAGILKVTRGVSEVISTIMLNAIAAALIGFLLRDGGWSPDPGGRKPFTETIDQSGWFPDLNKIVNPILDALGFDPPPPSTKTYGFIVIALLLGVVYAFLLKRTRFGFDLRASGQNPTAAAASGVSAKKMTIYAMFISGGIAGLVGMAELLGGNQHNFSETFLSGFGFIGIAVALLGRNSPVGMFFAAIVWAFLDVATRGFQIIGISNKLASIMQAVVLFAVVIAYTVVSRRAKEAEARSVAANTPAHPAEIPDGGPPSTDSTSEEAADVEQPHQRTTDSDSGEGTR